MIDDELPTAIEEVIETAPAAWTVEACGFHR
jgi:hypothetical protein